VSIGKQEMQKRTQVF